MALSSSDSHSGCVSYADSLTLNLVKQLEPGEYNIALKLTDGQGLSHVTTVKAIVCNCDGSAKNCDRKAFLPAAIETSAILGILGGILALLSEYCAPLLLVTPGEAGQFLLRSHPQNSGLPSAWMRGPSQAWPDLDVLRTLASGEGRGLDFACWGKLLSLIPGCWKHLLPPRFWRTYFSALIATRGGELGCSACVGIHEARAQHQTDPLASGSDQ